MKNDYKQFLDELNMCYTSLTFEVFPDTEVLWFPENKSLFIRGSDSIVDWYYNLRAYTDNVFGFHQGFYDKAFHLFIECINKKIKPTTVVGHSKGAAVAQLVGYWFKSEAYSLACPPTISKNKSDKDFLTWADKNLIIINQERDIISYLPPWFSHPIEPLWLNSEDYFYFAHQLVSFE